MDVFTLFFLASYIVHSLSLSDLSKVYSSNVHSIYDNTHEKENGCGCLKSLTLFANNVTVTVRVPQYIDVGAVSILLGKGLCDVDESVTVQRQVLRVFLFT